MARHGASIFWVKALNPTSFGSQQNNTPFVLFVVINSSALYIFCTYACNKHNLTSTLDGWTATQLGLVITEVSRSRAESSFSWGLNSFTTGIESVVRHSQSGFNYWCEIVNEWEKKTVWEGLLCFCCWLLELRLYMWQLSSQWWTIGSTEESEKN